MNRQHLKNLYDCINEIAREHKARGHNRDNWFYSDSEFEQVKKDRRNTLL